MNSSSWRWRWGLTVQILAVLYFASWTPHAAMAAIQHDQPLTLAKRMATTSMSAWAVMGPAKDRFQYELGVFLRGIELVWKATHEAKYFDYIKFKVDRFVAPNGTIASYNFTDFTLDNILTGRLVLTLYKQTGEPKYKAAAKILRQQLAEQPRTKEDGFWHKLVYPNQMWLDGLYMAEPFYAEYAKRFHEARVFDDVAKQFVLMEEHARDATTGLLYHGYDASRAQNWSNPRTGDSPSFWGRAMGWYFMALVDTLEFFPSRHPQHATLLAILDRVAVAVAKVQDGESGLWWQVLDMPHRRGNYLESSASAMFVYSYARGVRKGYFLRRKEGLFLEVARKGWEGIVREFVVETPCGGLNFTRICAVGGLGGTPYRNGTFEYYISEPIVTNDAKGVGAFMMAAVEISRAQL